MREISRKKKGQIYMNSEIGQRIKELRKERNMTLTSIAEKTDLSLGFLSKLERDLTSPTIANLHKVCNALNITLNDILDTNPVHQDVCIVRNDEQKILFEQDNGGLRYKAMTIGDTEIKVTSMTISNDQLYPFTPHDHDELGIIIQGILALNINDKDYYLYPGDTIYISARTMHTGKRASDEACISYWIKQASLNLKGC